MERGTEGDTKGLSSGPGVGSGVVMGSGSVLGSMMTLGLLLVIVAGAAWVVAMCMITPAPKAKTTATVGMNLDFITICSRIER